MIHCLFRGIGAGLLLAGLLAQGCQPSRPDHVLPPGQMVQVLSEFHLADAASSQFSGPAGLRDSLRLGIQLQVLQRAGISQAQFYESYSWYLQHPDEMDTLYSQVLHKLNRQIK